MPSKQFPNPTKPHSLKKIVKKALKNKKYAKFIHGQVRKARGGDAAAKATLNAHFKPQRSELKALKIAPSKMPMLAQCTDNTHLLDFTAHV
jgi:hypothetical protein